MGRPLQRRKSLHLVSQGSPDASTESRAGIQALAGEHTVFAPNPIELRANWKRSVAQDRLSCIVQKKAVFGRVYIVALSIGPFLQELARLQSSKSFIIRPNRQQRELSRERNSRTESRS